MNKQYDDETLKRVQDVELEILKDFMDLCDSNQLTYFGIAGTGIGVIRHKGFIPWDDDIDIALPRADYEKFLRLAKKHLSDQYIVMNCEENPNYPLMTTRLMKRGSIFREEALKNVDCPLGIFLDIYAFDNVSDDPDECKKQFRLAWFYSKLLILRSIPFPVLGFHGIKAKIIHVACGVIHMGLVCCRISKKWIYRKCNEVCCRYNAKYQYV